jgi:hypothetical protein
MIEAKYKYAGFGVGDFGIYRHSAIFQLYRDYQTEWGGKPGQSFNKLICGTPWEGIKSVIPRFMPLCLCSEVSIHKYYQTNN